MLSRRFALTVALLVLVRLRWRLGDGGLHRCAGDNDPVCVRLHPSTAATTASGCGVTLADVQALLAANSGVTQNRTPEATRCNFTWNDNGPRGIDVARVPGGRAAFKPQSAKLPSGPTTLKDGTA